MAQAVNGDAPQFHVHERQHFVECRAVAVAPVDQELSNTSGGRRLNRLGLADARSLLLDWSKAKLRAPLRVLAANSCVS